MLNSEGRLKDPIESWCPWQVITALHSFRQPDTPDLHLEDALRSSVDLDDAHVSSIMSSTRKPLVDPRKLARNWGIGLEAAQHMIEATTQRGLRIILHNTLSQ